jgi:hypothetical protein
MHCPCYKSINFLVTSGIPLQAGQELIFFTAATQFARGSTLNIKQTLRGYTADDVTIKAKIKEEVGMDRVEDKTDRTWKSTFGIGGWTVTRYRKFETNISRKGTVRLQSQFLD